MSLIGSSSFGFAQNTIHEFQNTVLNSSGIVFDTCHKNKSCESWKVSDNNIASQKGEVILLKSCKSYRAWATILHKAGLL